MLLFEHDAKELLAVQGIPVPGGIRLDHIPDTGENAAGDRSGPWIVKPQILHASEEIYEDVSIEAATNSEIIDAASRLIGSTINGQRVHSVWIERRFTPQNTAAIRFECDWGGAGINLTVTDSPATAKNGTAMSHHMLLPPDPSAVVEGLESLAASLPGSSRDCVYDAGRRLTPLFFGYEALLLQIDPIMLLNDGGWAVGGVNLSLDHNALFRHPELVTMIERRDYAYAPMRLQRRFGLEHTVLAPDGSIAVLVNGRGAGSCIAEELQQNGLPLHSVTTADTPALGAEADSLGYYLDWLRTAAHLRILFISIYGEDVDLMTFAATLDQALSDQPDPDLTVVLRLLGEDASKAAEAIRKEHENVVVTATFDQALDAIRAQNPKGRK